VIGWTPVQPPSAAVSVERSSGVPVIVGGAVLLGRNAGFAWTIGVSSDGTCAVAGRQVRCGGGGLYVHSGQSMPVTSTRVRRRNPMSPAVAV
jgi:hypothetical protein